MNDAAAVGASLGAVDLAMLAVLAVSALVGAWRGLMFELLALAGWIAAVVAAWAWGPLLAAPIGAWSPWPWWTPQAPVVRAVAAALVFFAVLAASRLLAALVRRLVAATPLTFVDRLAGAAFGALRGAVLLWVAVQFVAATPWRDAPGWTASRGVALLKRPWADLLGAPPAEADAPPPRSPAPAGVLR